MFRRIYSSSAFNPRVWIVESVEKGKWKKKLEWIHNRTRFVSGATPSTYSLERISIKEGWI